MSVRDFLHSSSIAKKWATVTRPRDQQADPEACIGSEGNVDEGEARRRGYGPFRRACRNDLEVARPGVSASLPAHNAR